MEEVDDEDAYEVVRCTEQKNTAVKNNPERNRWQERVLRLLSWVTPWPNQKKHQKDKHGRCVVTSNDGPVTSDQRNPVPVTRTHPVSVTRKEEKTVLVTRKESLRNSNKEQTSGNARITSQNCVKRVTPKEVN